MTVDNRRQTDNLESRHDQSDCQSESEGKLGKFCKYFHIDLKYQKCKSIPAVRRHQCEVEKTINILGPCRWFLPPGTVKLASRELWRAGKQGVAKKVAKI